MNDHQTLCVIQGGFDGICQASGNVPTHDQSVNHKLDAMFFVFFQRKISNIKIAYLI
jgi:hypothetical protein